VGLKGQSVPDNLRFLRILHNIGATSPDKSLTLEEISRWILIDPQKVRENLEELIKNDYVKVNRDGDTEKFHVTARGIVKVMSMYS